MSTNQQDIPYGPPNPAADLGMRRQTREERIGRFQSLIDNFTYSLGSGLSASANAPPGARNRTMAGVGAALTAPLALRKAQEQFELQKAQELRIGAQTDRLNQQTENAQQIPLINPATGEPYLEADGRPVMIIRALAGTAYAKAKAQEAELRTRKDIAAGVQAGQNSRQGAALAATGTEKALDRITQGNLQQLRLTSQETTAGLNREASSARKTTTQKDYEYYAAQEQAAGRTPSSFADYQDRIANLRKSQGNPVLDALRSLSIEDRTSVSPGQLVSASTGRPVKATAEETKSISDFTTAIEQSNVVKGLLDKIGSTGAIKGYVLNEGIYWPVAQDNVTPDQAAAVAEVQRLVNSYIYAVSGKAISEPELQRINKTVPSLRLTPQANQQVLQGFQRFITSQRDTYMRLRGWKTAGPATAAPDDGIETIDLRNRRR